MEEKDLVVNYYNKFYSKFAFPESKDFVELARAYLKNNPDKFIEYFETVDEDFKSWWEYEGRYKQYPSVADIDEDVIIDYLGSKTNDYKLKLEMQILDDVARDHFSGKINITPEGVDDLPDIDLMADRYRLDSGKISDELGIKGGFIHDEEIYKTEFFKEYDDQMLSEPQRDPLTGELDDIDYYERTELSKIADESDIVPEWKLELGNMDGEYPSGESSNWAFEPVESSREVDWEDLYEAERDRTAAQEPTERQLADERLDNEISEIEAAQIKKEKEFWWRYDDSTPEQKDFMERYITNNLTPEEIAQMELDQKIFELEGLADEAEASQLNNLGDTDVPNTGKRVGKNILRNIGWLDPVEEGITTFLAKLGFRGTALALGVADTVNYLGNAMLTAVEAKGRTDIVNSKLLMGQEVTEEEILQIREDIKESWSTNMERADKYGIFSNASRQIGKILNRQNTTPEWNQYGTS